MDIINDAENIKTLVEYFIGRESGEYYDGSDYQLYLDTDNNKLSINHEASSNSWLQRGDNSLIQIHHISGYCDTPEGDLFTDGCDIYDSGFAEFIDEIEYKIKVNKGANHDFNHSQN